MLLAHLDEETIHLLADDVVGRVDRPGIEIAAAFDCRLQDTAANSLCDIDPPTAIRLWFTSLISHLCELLMSTSDRDVSRPNPPTPERLAEIEAGIVQPTPYEREYLAQQAAEQQTSGAQAGPEPDADESKYVREEMIVPEAERGPWYNPHPGSLENAKRALKPAVIVNSIYLVVSTIPWLLPGGAAEFEVLGTTAFLAIIIVTLGISVAVMLWAACGSLIAHYFIFVGNTQSTPRIVDLFQEGEWGPALIASALLITVLTFWIISFSALQRHDRYRKGKLDL